MKIVLNKNQNIWFSSDFHYGHGSIVKGVSRWENKNGCRDFETLNEHDDALVNNINAVVKENDILFFLGDWSFGDYKTRENVTNISKFRNLINCKNIHLIYGNHDEEIIKNSDSVQSLFNSVSNYRELCIVDGRSNIKAIKYNLVLFHYAMRVWNGSHRGSWALYGHSHGTLDELTPLIANPTWIGDGYYVKNYRTMDVGIDCHPEFRPFSFDEIKSIMESKSIELEVDHHEK